MYNATGYGPRRDVGNRWSRLCFDGDEKNYEIWETKFLGYLRLQGLKETILQEPGEDDVNDEVKNEEAYAELIQFLDDKSLSLVMREATDNGRKALTILRDHYAGKGKPRVISLYTELTSLQKAANESVTDYIIRAETAITALRNAEENLSDGLLIAMILKGLPESFKVFAIHITQGDEKMEFTEFKTKLRSFESTEKQNANSSDDGVMKVTASTSGAGGRESITCFNCNQKGHIARACPNEQHQRPKQWCSFCRSPTHRNATCRRRMGDDAKQAIDAEEENEHGYAFKISERQLNGSRQRGLMVDTGATSHIITDIEKFKNFDNTFQPEKHVLELADGTRTCGVASKRGDAEIFLINSEGQRVKATLKRALYIPSYPQDIFSVKTATTNGASVNFKQGRDQLIHKDGTRFDIKEYNRLYYLNTYSGENDDECNACYDIQTWHEILGHCNYDDVSKLQNVVEGMKIKGPVDRSNLNCEVCIQGKFAQSRNREPDERAKAALDLVHTDLAGPIEPEAKDGFLYVLSFTDDYTSVVFVYFLKVKSDTAKATEKFIADTAPYGKIKCIRSDNGTEYTGGKFQALLSKNSIRHETSAPYSPHQNGTAERNWRTLFEMGRCMLIESNLPKELWTYAVMTAAVIRNRCYNSRVKQTPYYMLTGKKPDLSKMRVF